MKNIIAKALATLRERERERELYFNKIIQIGGEDNV